MPESPPPDIILPPELQAKLDRGEPLKVVCPAGEPRRDRRNGRQGVYCKIEQATLTLAASPLAVACLCCFDYHECPTWQADKDEDPVVERQQKAIAQGEQDAITRRQIAHGARVDDEEEREYAKWMEDELRRQEAEPTANDMGVKGQSSILLPPGYRAEEDDTEGGEDDGVSGDD